ncbi:MAG: Smr/MutS family protein [Anaerofustis sp.]
MENTHEIDIHGMTVAEAEAELDHFLEYEADSLGELVVVHGYRQGTRLLEFVRKEFRHPKIKQKMLSMNPGITIFILKIQE